MGKNKKKGEEKAPTSIQFSSFPLMNNASGLMAWLRNDNAAIRSWAALAQCGMQIEFIDPRSPPEEAPYGQVVGWRDPVSIIDVDGYEWREYNPMWDGWLPLTQASAQGFWDKYVACRDGLLPEDGWSYDPDRIARAELFGDPEAYLAAYAATSKEELSTATWNFEGLLYFPLYDSYMDIVPRAEIQAFIAQTSEFVGRAEPRWAEDD